MNLTTRGSLMIGIPLGLQIVMTVILFANSFNLQQTLSRESYAKQVLGNIDQLHQLAADAAVTIAALRFASPEESRASTKRILNRIASLSNELKELSKKKNFATTQQAGTLSPEAKAIADHVLLVEHLSDLVFDLSNADTKQTEKPAFATVLREYDFNFDFLMTLRKISASSNKLHELFSSMAQEATPEGIQRQEFLNILLSGALVVNVALAVTLAALFGRSATGRLRMLMKNVDTFASGMVDLQSVPGKDEISLLDEKFRSMAEKRWNAEQERSAVLQTVSHDIRGPISAIHMTINGIVQSYQNLTPDKILSRLTRLTRETDRIVDLCTTFLHLESIESGKLILNIADVSVTQLLSNVRDSTLPLTESANIGIEINCPAECSIRCDEQRVEQILINLLSNAIKFSPPDTVIRLDVSTDDTSTTINVTDQGPGMTGSDIKTLFEKFSQLKNAEGKGGSGLGLWICKRLIEFHNAEIGCNSEPGQGATFWVRFPRTK